MSDLTEILDFSEKRVTEKRESLRKNNPSHELLKLDFADIYSLYQPREFGLFFPEECRDFVIIDLRIPALEIYEECLDKVIKKVSGRSKSPEILKYAS